MKNEPNPIPLLADASTPDELRSLLTVARAHGPSQAALERLSQRLSPLVGVAPADLSAPPPDLGTAPVNPEGFSTGLTIAGQTATRFTLPAVGKALVTAAVVSVGAIWWSTTGVPVPRALPAAPKPAAWAPAPQVAAPAPENVKAVDPIPQMADPEPAPRIVARRARPASPVIVETPSKSEVQPAVPASAEVPSEFALIKRAEDMRGQPQALLQTLEEHARLYPAGQLAQEREVLAIEALLASGRRPEAEARAAALFAQHPGSAHLRRVRVLLGDGRSE